MGPFIFVFVLCYTKVYHQKNYHKLGVAVSSSSSHAIGTESQSAANRDIIESVINSFSFFIRDRSISFKSLSPRLTKILVNLHIMDKLCILLLITCLMMSISAWSLPYYPVQRAPLRVYRYATPPRHHRIPVEPEEPQQQQQRPKRGHDHRDYDDDHQGTSGVTGPVHTFVKTDKNANYKWGVRHHVGNKYAS